MKCFDFILRECDHVLRTQDETFSKNNQIISKSLIVILKFSNKKKRL